ncbi:MAG: aromatic acid exporter family protein [Solirubrobacterales bacterium]
MKIIGTRTIKTGVGVSISMLAASSLGLKYAAAAGIITMLSIQSTKRESIQIAVQRIGACILALLISAVLFNIFGYNPIVFGVFLFIFIPLTVKLNLEQGIVVSSVIVTHLLVERITSFPLILNELELIFIGVSIALILNLYMPGLENVIKEDQKYIEDCMKKLLLKMAAALKENNSSFSEDELFKDLGERIKIGKQRAYKNLNNYLISDMSYYVEYMEMRRQQFKTLKKLKDTFRKFFIAYDQTIMVAEFTEKISNDFYESNTCTNLLNELEALRFEFKNMALPSTREEFENRAMLYEFLNEMEQFLLIKFEFMKNKPKV